MQPIYHLELKMNSNCKQKDTKEEFLTFVPLEWITGEAISQAILQFLQESKIPTSNMRGQGYDGTSNMSSDAVGVQAHIK